MRRNQLKKVLSLVVSSFMVASIAACGNTAPTESSIAETVATETQTAETPTATNNVSRTDEAPAVEFPAVEEVSASYVEYLATKGFPLSADAISVEEIELGSSMKVKGFQNDATVYLVRGLKVVEAESGFSGVVLEGAVDGEAVVIYFSPNETGKLVSPEGVRLASFLNTKQMKLF